LGWWAVWLQFIILAGFIMISGSRLCRYADILAAKTGLGRTWIGLVALAVVTSLPELVTGSSAILWIGVPDIAVGNLLGACVLNLALLAVADLIYPPGPILSAVDRGHILAAAFGVIMLGVVALALIGRNHLADLSIGGYVAFSSPVLLLCYVTAMRSTYRFQRRQRLEYLEEQQEEMFYPDLTLAQAAGKFGLHALVVIGAAIWLPQVAENLTIITGWQVTLVGTVFVAAVTTMPELVVTVSAMRLGAVDLAVGDLLGSLLVNIAILGGLDFLYTTGPLLRAVAPEHAVTVLVAVLMTGITVAELVYRPQKKTLRYLSLGTFLLAFLYAAHVFVQIVA
jgi:cation:H+ antiporter